MRAFIFSPGVKGPDFIDQPFMKYAYPFQSSPIPSFSERGILSFSKGRGCRLADGKTMG
jgi:hypothetical protein